MAGIGFALDRQKADDPVWAPIFEGYKPIRKWLAEKKPDVLLLIFNDHVTSFFFDHYSHFALGIGESYGVADEGGGARSLPPVAGHPALSHHIASSLVADEFVNPPPGGIDGIAAAAQAGWGVVQLPADDYPAHVADRLLFEVAEQSEEFARHGYDIVLVGQREGLADALARVGLAVPDGIDPASTVQLKEFLDGRPSPDPLQPSAQVRRRLRIDQIRRQGGQRLTDREPIDVGQSIRATDEPPRPAQRLLEASRRQSDLAAGVLY